MPQRKAGKKALKQNLKKRKKNLAIKKNMKSAIKQFKKSVGTTDAPASAQSLSSIYKILDKAAAQNIIHPRKAARKKSRLAKAAKPKTK